MSNKEYSQVGARVRYIGDRNIPEGYYTIAAIHENGWPLIKRQDDLGFEFRKHALVPFQCIIVDEAIPQERS